MLMAGPEYVTAPQLAAMFGVSEASIRRWAAAGLITDDAGHDVVQYTGGGHIRVPAGFARARQAAGRGLVPRDTRQGKGDVTNE